MKADPSFLVELGGLLLLLSLAGAIAWRIGLSAVPLFLIAGLMVGEGGVIPWSTDAAAPFLEIASGIGVVLLMLTLGLEFSAREFTQALKRHTPSGVVDLVLNAAPGIVVGILLDLPAAGVLAMGGITWISSSGIVSRTLSDLGRLGNRETPAVLSILVLEDIAMAAYLPLLGVVLAGSGVLTGVAGVVLGVGTVALALGLSHRGGAQLARLIRHDSDEQVLLRVLGLTLLVAGLAEYLGISSAVGAFLVGLAIPGDSAGAARRILAPLRDLFAAVFFLSFGYAVDPADIVPLLPVVIPLVIVTALTKIATGWYAARKDGVGKRGRWRAGTVLIPRGEFSIVIAGLAVSAGVLDVGPVATAYVLVIAVAGPLVTRLLTRRRELPNTSTESRAA